MQLHWMSLLVVLVASLTTDAHVLKPSELLQHRDISISSSLSPIHLLPRAPKPEEKQNDVHGRIGKASYSTGRTAGIVLGSLALSCAVLIGILEIWPGDGDSCCWCCLCCASSDAGRSCLGAYRNCSSGVKENCLRCCGSARRRNGLGRNRRSCWEWTKEKILCCGFWDRRGDEERRELRHESFVPARDWNSEFEGDDQGYQPVDVELGYRYVSDGMEPPMYTERTGAEGQERGVVEEDIGEERTWRSDGARAWRSRDEDVDAAALLEVGEKGKGKIVVMDLGESYRAREDYEESPSEAIDKKVCEHKGYSPRVCGK
ncbi:hypothetical protein BGZ60DRAFT_418268 [Tricladium varicosporioides]|nr:hypothetical protein BGZ60DRAFT_418268 [Hymenoscyphus varicosporioides]